VLFPSFLYNTCRNISRQTRENIGIGKDGSIITM